MHGHESAEKSDCSRQRGWTVLQKTTAIWKLAQDHHLLTPPPQQTTSKRHFQRSAIQSIPEMKQPKCPVADSYKLQQPKLLYHLVWGHIQLNVRRLQTFGNRLMNAHNDKIITQNWMCNDSMFPMALARGVSRLHCSLGSEHTMPVLHVAMPWKHNSSQTPVFYCTTCKHTEEMLQDNVWLIVNKYLFCIPNLYTQYTH